MTGGSAAVTDESMLRCLRDDVAATRRALETDPAAPVEHCPGWSIADLVRHHGSIQRWATRVVATGRAASDAYATPDDAGELARWYEDGAEALVAVLAATDPDRECWTLDRPPRRAWFWARRQALEAAIHRWDAQHALGPADDLPAGLAELGITEVVQDLFPRQVALGRARPLTGRLRLAASESGRVWDLGPERTDPSGVGLVEGPGSALVLFLWRRADLEASDVLSYTGPAPLLREVRATHFAP